jgi:hypothetical protein
LFLVVDAIHLVAVEFRTCLVVSEKLHYASKLTFRGSHLGLHPRLRRQTSTLR